MEGLVTARVGEPGVEGRSAERWVKKADPPYAATSLKKPIRVSFLNPGGD